VSSLFALRSFSFFLCLLLCSNCWILLHVCFFVFPLFPNENPAFVLLKIDLRPLAASPVNHPCRFLQFFLLRRSFSFFITMIRPISPFRIPCRACCSLLHSLFGFFFPIAKCVPPFFHLSSNLHRTQIVPFTFFQGPFSSQPIPVPSPFVARFLRAGAQNPFLLLDLSLIQTP